VPEFTDEQIADAIVSAIRERKYDTARSLIHLLAVQNPQYAQDVLDAIGVAAYLTNDPKDPK
jgi:Holliday junction resolvasome RuvABC endonuclease subunit